VDIQFHKGLTTITGETGAGKSILLGGLGLILGNRAESHTLLNPDKKCIIEGSFDIAKYNLKSFFDDNDLDFENQTIIRREILPSGKSRAFVNDTPVLLETLQELQQKLIDVHSQHQTLQINERSFQYNVIDSLAGNTELVAHYQELKKAYEKASKALISIESEIRSAQSQHDYHIHLYQELQAANLKEGTLAELETQQERLTHIETIQQNLYEAHETMQSEGMGAIEKLYNAKQNLDKIREYGKQYEELFNRLQSIYIEAQDIGQELSYIVDNENFSLDSLDQVNEKISRLQNLFQKHHVQTEAELINKYHELEQKIKQVTNSDKLLEEKKKELENLKKQLTDKANKISASRREVIPVFTHKIISILKDLGMKEAVFEVVLNPDSDFNTYGKDSMQWLFSANKGKAPGQIKQVASGGELSRIMLAIKSIWAEKAQLPSIIFDEIDTGISGEIAIKMGAIMQYMARDRQVICITHLPQIAAKGKEQFKVFKQTNHNQTKTLIKNLSTAERKQEIAEMLGGKSITETALSHADELLK
jgi:DNA repair protein RecN (Recombination protein N)